MIKKTVKSLLKPLPIAMLSAAIVRIVLFHVVGVLFFPSQNCDDVLMLSYAAVKSHFLEPNALSIVKTMVYPLFLDVVHVSHVPYDIWLSLLYVGASFSLYFSVKKVLKSRFIAAFGFFFFLFIPSSFDLFVGLRIYRNAIVMPLVVALFSMLIYAVYRSWFPEEIRNQKTWKNVVFYVTLGVVLTVAYYAREEGLWMMAVTIVALLFAAAGVIVKNRKDWKKPGLYVSVALLLVPFLLFAGNTAAYKAINYHFFGVYEIETRTDGEQGGFVKRLYKIDSEDRSAVYWTPADVLDKAADVSPTLQSAAELLDSMKTHETVSGNIYENPPFGDHMGWLLRYARIATGYFATEAEAEAFFKQVNAELDEAFANGTLAKADRIQILSSAGGFTLEEVLSLWREMAVGIYDTVLVQGYSIGAAEPNSDEIAENLETAEFAAFVTNEPYLANPTPRELTGLQKAVNVLLRIWSVLVGAVSAALFVAGFAAVFIAFFRLFRKEKKDLRRELFHWLTMCAFYAVGLVYLFGISWFSHFLWGDTEIDAVIFNFYLVSLPAIWLFGYLFTIRIYRSVFEEALQKRKEKKQKTLAISS